VQDVGHKVERQIQPSGLICQRHRAVLWSRIVLHLCHRIIRCVLLSMSLRQKLTRESHSVGNVPRATLSQAHTDLQSCSRACVGSRLGPKAWPQPLMTVLQCMVLHRYNTPSFKTEQGIGSLCNRLSEVLAFRPLCKKYTSNAISAVTGIPDGRCHLICRQQ